MTHRIDPLDGELQRSRRYGRPLSLIRVRPRNGNAAQLVAALEGMSRAVDHVWAVGGDVVILLPEADGSAARAFVDRACEPLVGTLARDATTASFPDDGLTRKALVAALNGDATSRVAAPPVPLRPAPIPLPRLRATAARRRASGAAAPRRRRGDHDVVDDRQRRQVG